MAEEIVQYKYGMPEAEFQTLTDTLKTRKIPWLSVRVDGNFISFFDLTHKTVATYNISTKVLR